MVVTVHGEQVKPSSRDRRFDPDLARIEPVLQLAAVEQQLQGADPQAQREESEDVERLAMDVAAVADEDEDPKRTQHADRQVDVENPAPAVTWSKPTAERRAHDRPADRADPEHRHRLPVPLRRVDLQQGSLRQRGTRPAPAIPCRARNATSSLRLVAAPHSAEASVKPATETRKMYLMPKRPASQPVSGIMIAAETM